MSANDNVTVEIPVRMLRNYRAALKAENAVPIGEQEKARENRLAEANLIAVWALLAYEEQCEEAGK